MKDPTWVRSSLVTFSQKKFFNFTSACLMSDIEILPGENEVKKIEVGSIAECNSIGLRDAPGRAIVGPDQIKLVF